MRLLNFTKILLVFLALFFYEVSAQQIINEKETLNNLYDVDFSDSLNGWIAGANTLLRTIDGGQTWSSNKLSNNGGSFFSIAGSEPSSAWVVWYNEGYSYIGRTSDAGLSWDTLAQANTGTISATSYYEVVASDSLHAWIIGSNSFLCECPAPVLKTSNGGISWDNAGLEVSGKTCNGFTSISVLTDSVAALLFCSRQLYETTDSGHSWEVDSLTKSYNKITFADKRHLWLVGNKGRILHSSDSGISWVQQVGDTNYNFLSLYALDSLNIWIVGTQGKILHTMDGGKSWDSVKAGTQLDLNAVYFSDINHGWFVGDSGLVVQYRNGAIITGLDNAVSGIPDFQLYQNYPNPSNPSTEIDYSLKSSGHVTLKIFDMLGRKIKTLVSEDESEGDHKVNFNASNLPSGIYFYTITSGNFHQTKKMVLLR